jgi:hypothetical protein
MNRTMRRSGTYASGSMRAQAQVSTRKKFFLVLLAAWFMALTEVA